MPVLSRGKHRNPKKGACFMELASFLAGEAWSDHPSCTHPLLASLARDVNDHVDDFARSRLAPLIPEVIGLNGDGPARGRLDRPRGRARGAAGDRRRSGRASRRSGCCAASGCSTSSRAAPSTTSTRARAAALDDVPHARDWARGFTALGWGSRGSFAKRSAPAIVHSAVSGIAAASVPNADELLVDLLERTIVLCRGWFAHEPAVLGRPGRCGSQIVRITRRADRYAAQSQSLQPHQRLGDLGRSRPRTTAARTGCPTTVSKSIPGAVAMPGLGQQPVAERHRVVGQVAHVGVHVERAVGRRQPVDAEPGQPVEQQPRGLRRTARRGRRTRRTTRR